MPAALTNIAVRNAKVDPSRRLEIGDGGSGLYLVVQPTGAKSWALRYRAEGKPVKLTLGPALALQGGEEELHSEPEIGKPLTLKGARLLAATLLRKIARGDDPAVPHRAKKAAPKADRDVDLFELVAVDFINRYARGANRDSSWRETARLLGFKPDDADPLKLVRRTAKEGAFAGVAHHWEGRRIQDIKKRDVIDLLDAIAEGGAPFSANRAFAAIRKLFNWCVERDRLAMSPCVGVKPPTAEVSRDRVLTDGELALVWKAADVLGDPFGPFIKMLILTGQRRDEVADMTWDEVDESKQLWVLPRERVKNNSTHAVPLSSTALTVLAAVPKISGEPAFVFTTGSGRRQPQASGNTVLVPISGFSKAKLKLDEAIQALRRREAIDADRDPEALEPLATWRLHDLRRTVASGMARLGVTLPVIEKVLNHRSGTFAGIVGVYQRHSFAAEKQVALQTWASFVEGVVAGEAADNVVPFRAGIQ